MLARLVLAAVFLLAGVAKLADPRGASKAFAEFGLAKAPAALLALVLPVIEMGVAVALIPAQSAWYGAWAALALFGIFIAAITINLIRGRKPDCHCFGQLHSAPVGRSTLIRNAVLGAIAAWLVALGPMHDGPSLWDYLIKAGDNERRLFAVAGFIMAFLVWRASKQRRAEPVESAEPWALDWEDEEEGPAAATPAPKSPPTQPRPPRDPALRKILLEGNGWPVGTRAPDFTLPDTSGQKCSLESMREQGKTICLVFSSPHCEPCRALWPYVTRWAKEYEQGLNTMVISRGAGAENLARKSGFDLTRVLLQQEFEISEAYGVTTTPAAVLIGADGAIQSGLSVGREDIAKLFATALLRSGQTDTFT